MIWSVTGDIHRNYNNRFKYYTWQKDPGHALIVLGDLGFNYLLDERDRDWKRGFCNKYNFQLYAVRGNHEERPQNIFGMQLIYDKNVNGEVYWEPEYPNIHYFKDFGEYEIDGYKVLVIGGAYSVDKYWRLERAMMTEETNNPKKSGWFANEQLTKEEMNRASEQLYMFKDMGKHIHFILSHTCPYEWEPRDMFLGSVDQSTVDDSMECWMDQIKDDIHCDVWCFGHFHADRIERPGVEQYYHDMEELDEIYNRWNKYKTDKELPWHLVKGPNFYA